jgi:hypothetical protein
MHTILLTLRDRLSLEPIASPPRKKSRTTFGSPVNDSKEDEERTCLDEIRGRGGEEFDAITTHGKFEEKLESNLDQVTNNIQDELVVFVELVIELI